MSAEIDAAREAMAGIDPLLKLQIDKSAQAKVGPMCVAIRDGSRSWALVGAACVLLLCEALEAIDVEGTDG